MGSLSTSQVVGVVGAGAMGAGIAQVAAAGGHPVRLYDAAEGAAEEGRARIEKGLKRQIARGKVTKDKVSDLMARIEVVPALQDLAGSALVVEAIIEDIEIKRTLFASLEEILEADAILATNTSSISVTLIGRDLKRPERLVGMHFFNPAPVMKLVEVISGVATDDGVAETVFDTAEAWGKLAVRAKSTPGFIVNRVARSFYGEALRLFEEKVADPATLDGLITQGGGFRMGPFQLMDLIGHDVNYAVSVSVYNAYYQDPRFRPSLAQLELVNAGRLGRKAGIGFYEYAEDARDAEPAKETDTVEGVTLEDFVLGEEYETGAVTIRQTDGRTAGQVAAKAGMAAIIYDLIGEGGTRVAFAATDDVPQAVRDRFVATLHAAGVTATLLPDWPGLVLMRTVAALANEGFDTVLQGVADEAAIDTAMRYGLNFPRGPIGWAREIGLGRVLSVLDSLQTMTGDPRYRVSMALRMAVE